MTIEELRQVEKEVNEDLIKLREKERNAKLAFVASNKVADYGDMVLVTNGRGQSVKCFVGTPKYIYGGIDYDLRKIKKDGTISEQSAGIHYPEKIEVLK